MPNSFQFYLHAVQPPRWGTGRCHVSRFSGRQSSCFAVLIYSEIWIWLLPGGLSWSCGVGISFFSFLSPHLAQYWLDQVTDYDPLLPGQCSNPGLWSQSVPPCPAQIRAEEVMSLWFLMSFSTQCYLDRWSHVRTQNRATALGDSQQPVNLSPSQARQQLKRCCEALPFGLFCQMSSGDLAFFVVSVSYEKYVMEHRFTLKYPVIHLPVAF